MIINLNFVQENKEGIDELNKKVAEVIKSFNIDTSGNLTPAKCLKISGEINKSIKSIKSLASAISNLEAGDKTAIILAITIETLNSEEVKSVLSDSQIKQIEQFCEDTENVETIIALVDWVADEVLDTLDLNNDGVVTKDEVEEVCINGCLCANKCGQGPEGCGCYQPKGCCACCPSFVSNLAYCWSNFFIRVLCCKSGKDSIEINSNKNNQNTQV